MLVFYIFKYNNVLFSILLLTLFGLMANIVTILLMLSLLLMTSPDPISITKNISSAGSPYKSAEASLYAFSRWWKYT